MTEKVRTYKTLHRHMKIYRITSTDSSIFLLFVNNLAGLWTESDSHTYGRNSHLNDFSEQRNCHKSGTEYHVFFFYTRVLFSRDYFVNVTSQAMQSHTWAEHVQRKWQKNPVVTHHQSLLSISPHNYRPLFMPIDRLSFTFIFMYISALHQFSYEQMKECQNDTNVWKTFMKCNFRFTSLRCAHSKNNNKI